MLVKSLLFHHPLCKSVLELEPLQLLNRGGLGPFSDQSIKLKIWCVTLWPGGTLLCVRPAIQAPGSED